MNLFSVFEQIFLKNVRVAHVIGEKIIKSVVAISFVQRAKVDLLSVKQKSSIYSRCTLIVRS